MNKKRYLLIDGIRGIAILNMIAFHFLYDLNEIIGAAGYMLDIHPGIGICLEDKQKNSCKTGDIFKYLWICDYAGDSNRYSGRSGLVWNPEFYGIHT